MLLVADRALVRLIGINVQKPTMFFYFVAVKMQTYLAHSLCC